MEKEIEDALLNPTCLDILTQEDLENASFYYELDEDQQKEFNEIFAGIL